MNTRKQARYGYVKVLTLNERIILCLCINS